MRVICFLILMFFIFNNANAREKILNYSLQGTIIDEPEFYESDSKEMAVYKFKILTSENKEIYVSYFVRRIGVQLSDEVPIKGQPIKKTATFFKSDDAKSKIFGFAEINNDLPVNELLKIKKADQNSERGSQVKLTEKIDQLEVNVKNIKKINTELGDLDEINKNLKEFEYLMKDKENKRKIDDQFSKQVVFNVQLQLNEEKIKLGGKNGFEASFSQTLVFYLPLKVVDINSLLLADLNSKAKNDISNFISKNKEKNWLFEKRKLSSKNNKIELSLYALAPKKNYSMSLSEELIQDLIQLNPGESVVPLSKKEVKNKYDCIVSSNGNGKLCVFKVMSANKSKFTTFRQLKKDGSIYGLQVSALDQKYEKIALELFFQTGGVVEELMSPTLSEQENLKKSMLKSISELNNEDDHKSGSTKKAFELIENYEKNPNKKNKEDISNFAQHQYDYYSAKARQSYAKLKLLNIYTALKSYYSERQDYTTDLALLNIEPSEDKNQYVCGFFSEYIPKKTDLEFTNKKTYINDLFGDIKSVRNQFVNHFPKDSIVNPKKGFKAACVGNIDNDAKLDVWTIDENKLLINIQSDLPE